MLPVEMCGTPRYAASFAAWVPLPAPGGPSRTSLISRRGTKSAVKRLWSNPRPRVLDLTGPFGAAAALCSRVEFAHPLIDFRREFPESREPFVLDRKSTRLNSSHVSISYAVFCLKKKNRRDIELA